ncbi:peptidyl-tRNA hydrolase [Ehrlichia chaffeensis str. Heartland]|uniref:Peptidyl-tRNA hydrolase n=1 Tax=Ehrlichia chaffeensis (strain ATCC CRL-10679 / Arkansas) TaxID=205920 RepID=PTH_EHRCR|nr:aminoacyl-tRNA hydrolase [Ehrlichia chaffeensis]Q2GHW4.1 RecName: Full=Peptidyl-tRNA hydrolase; Short=PTH [Ehrlichia chaffeensis str. Arkansas]ABD45087.1 peptidyl-tRNA hydrolase [Ehrlichia chaffeensis str. Arkansas]AHX04061.1 peptidyl-tRNA hydrolase [Ehrlichia chaffeensis str. Heartland]AHX05994.1 peptidyl-tRNA hydrolase [Ehrlichia chaffeensis str. Jax]AHX06984.1 peptidyl-tRNA hydrolase [Ehrlichia chaffeensis str. Liberty]AHX07536.1 peptidyl-tRNA hydrolase [Ehrlichia chaffeensis str. Osceo
MFYLLAGLGNPGKKYELSRHNAGFMIVDAIASEFYFPSFRERHNALISIGNIKSHRVILVKPWTFMNNSGAPIMSIASLYKIPLDNIIIFHDEVEINFCTIRVKKSGGNAGHNGLKSIDNLLGKDYWRVRFGIGRPINKTNLKIDLSYYVLSQFHNIKAVNNTILNIVEHITLLLEKKPSMFMEKVKNLIKYEDIPTE